MYDKRKNISKELVSAFKEGYKDELNIFETIISVVTKVAKLAGLKEMPAIIKEKITDEETLLIVTETNLLYRSFSDMCHKERAMVLA